MMISTIYHCIVLEPSLADQRNESGLLAWYQCTYIWALHTPELQEMCRYSAIETAR